MDNNMLYDNYNEFLDSCGSANLIDVAYTMGVSHDLDQLEKIKSAALRTMIHDHVFGHAPEWIDDLPLNDLQMLQLLAETGSANVEDTGQMLIGEIVGLLHYTGDDDTDNGLYEMRVTDDVRQLVAPLLADAIERKQASGEGAMECALCGMLNLTGRMLDRQAIGLLERLLLPCDSRVTKQGIDNFVNHSMLVRAFTCYDTDDDVMLYSRLVDREWWEFDLRDVEPYVPSDIGEIMAHGSYPYFTPTRECEKDFCQLLRDMGGLDHDEALGEFTYYYGELQDAQVSIGEVMRLMVDACGPQSKADLKKAMRVVQNFCNGIPKFFLCGQSSQQVSGIQPMGDPSLEGLWHAPAPKGSGATMPGIDMPLPMISLPKVGRNDPCPCGSGKKYKNCCGMDN